jgi:hypothetical protein
MNKKTQTKTVESVSKSINNFFSGLGFILKSVIILSVLSFCAVWMYGVIRVSFAYDIPLFIITGTAVLLVPLAVFFGISKLGQRVSE